MQELEKSQKELLEACHLKLVGELDLTEHDIADKLGYSPNYVINMLSRVRNGKISARDQAYLKDRFPEKMGCGYLKTSKAMNGKRKRLLVFCHLKLTGELELTIEQIAEQLGYAPAYVKKTLSRVKTGKIDEREQAYLSKRFSGKEDFKYMESSKSTSERRKKLLEACYLKLYGSLDMTAEEIAKQTGYAAQSVRFTLSCMNNDKLSAPDTAYINSKFSEEIPHKGSCNTSEKRKELLDLCSLVLDGQLIMTTEEIAKHLGYSPRYVKSTLSKIRHGKVSGASKSYLEESNHVRYQAMKVADRVQSYFSEQGIGVIDIDEIKRNCLATELSELNQALEAAQNTDEAVRITSSYRQRIMVMNLALNIVNQRIGSSNDLEDDTMGTDFIFEHTQKETSIKAVDDSETLDVPGALSKKRI